MLSTLLRNHKEEEKMPSGMTSHQQLNEQTNMPPNSSDILSARDSRRWWSRAVSFNVLCPARKCHCCSPLLNLLQVPPFTLSILES